jgi:2,3-bisphosphoglycerate-independent phosphoglycerate mutase
MIAGNPVARILPLSEHKTRKNAARTAKALNQYLGYAHRMLANHDINRIRRKNGEPPANFLATQRCGRRVKQIPFDERWGLSAMLMASGVVYGGLAQELGMTFKAVNDSARPDKDLRQRVQMAFEDEAHEFVHVHTKVPDEAGHKGDPIHKRDMISMLDEGIDELVSELEKKGNLFAAMTADHSTPSISPLIHSGEPSPLALVGPHVRRDHVRAFDEISVSSGCLGFIRGAELMMMILNYTNRSSLLGHRLGPVETAFFPGNYEPFKL